jgi:hypothetical protein
MHTLFPDFSDNSPPIPPKGRYLSGLILCLALLSIVGCASTSPSQHTLSSSFLSARLKQHVQALSDAGPRCLENPGSLDTGALYIAEQLRSMGYGVRLVPFKSRGLQVTNVEAVREGGLAAKERVLAVAHYDSVPDSPGADDNASGVAALLEAARLARLRQCRRSLHFVFTVNEELPNATRSREKGAVRRARTARHRHEKIRAVLVVDGIGYYSDAPGSQKNTALKEFATNRGDFLALVTLSGNRQNRPLLDTTARLFRQHTDLPVRTTVLGWASWPYYSDLGPFLDMGFPSVLATDTGPLRSPHYHRPDDRPDTLDYTRAAQATRGLAHVLFGLAQE